MNYVTTRDLQESTIVQEVTYIFNYQIISYILTMLICVCMILLDNLLQCFICADVIDLSRTCKNIIILIYNSLVMFISYF
jgi:hypothetical protein